MKKISLICIVILLLFTVISCSVEEIEVSSMVYASGSELESVYEALQKDSWNYAKVLETYELTIVKESITPVYTVDMLEYSRTNKLNIIPVYAGKTGKGKVYSAKMVNKNGDYAGCIHFYVEDGIAHYMTAPPQPIKDGSKIMASPSYADHEKRIQKCLKEENIISPFDVKYVSIGWVGDFFYVKNQKHEAFISVGYMIANSSVNDPIGQEDYMIDRAKLKQIADQQRKDYEARLAEKEQWEKEHPGEEWIVPDGG